MFRLKSILARSLNPCSVRSMSNANVRVSVQNGFVVVETSHESDATKQLKFPSIWLRDNCQCDKCFHASSMSRSVDWTAFDFTKSKPKSVTSIEDGLKVIWDDAHVSKFPFHWLNERNFTVENRMKYLQNVYRLPPRLWSKNDFKLEHFEFDDIMDSDDGLAAWLKSLTINCVTLIKNASLDESVCRQLANRVGFIRKTHYGEVFILKAKENANNPAFVSMPLQIHTDSLYYDYKPGVNMLHCIVQSKSAGAFNLLTDGFYVAERIKREHPDFYEILTKTLVNWSDYGEEDGNCFQEINRAPVICLDQEGNLQRINHSVPQRDSFFSIDADAVDSCMSVQ